MFLPPVPAKLPELTLEEIEIRRQQLIASVPSDMREEFERLTIYPYDTVRVSNSLNKFYGELGKVVTVRFFAPVTSNRIGVRLLVDAMTDVNWFAEGELSVIFRPSVETLSMLYG